MAHDVEFSFEDNSVVVNKKISNIVEGTLVEISAELVSQTARNTSVGTGKTKGSWAADIFEKNDGYEVKIGSSEENAIWEEFGTGEYAITENGGRGGRQGAWYVPVEKVVGKKKPTYNGKVIIVHGKNGQDYYKTNGKKPTRAFWNAYKSSKNKIIKHIQDALKEV